MRHQASYDLPNLNILMRYQLRRGSHEQWTIIVDVSDVYYVINFCVQVRIIVISGSELRKASQPVLY